MERKKLAPGVFITTLDAEKFNRCRITIHLRYPAIAPPAQRMPLCCRWCWNAAMRLPGYDGAFPQLARLYGADLGVDQSSAGIDRVLTVDICASRIALPLTVRI